MISIRIGHAKECHNGMQSNECPNLHTLCGAIVPQYRSIWISHMNRFFFHIKYVCVLQRNKHIAVICAYIATYTIFFCVPSPDYDIFSSVYIFQTAIKCHFNTIIHSTVSICTFHSENLMILWLILWLHSYLNIVTSINLTLISISIKLLLNLRK